MRLPLAALLVLAVACGGTDAASTSVRDTVPLEPVIRDSAGIELAEHPADAFDRASLITMDTTAVTTFGGPDSEIDLSGVYHAIVIGGGRLAFFAAGSVVIVGPDGRVEARIGREGEGPGEFRFARLVPGQGDTILVPDQLTSRVSWVTPTAGVARTRPFVMYSGARARVVVGQLREGTFVVGTMMRPLPKDVARIDWPLSAELAVPGSDSSMPLATVRGRALQVRQGHPERVEFLGDAQVALASDTIVMTEGRRWEWLVVRRTGGVARIVRIVGPGQPIDPARVREAAELEIAAIRASIVASGEEGGDTASTFADLRNKVVADTLGAIMGVWVGSDGTLWAKDGRYLFVEQPPVTYTALRPSGVILGRLVIPKDRTAIAFGERTVVLREEDADGFVTLKVHRLNGLR